MERNKSPSNKRDWKKFQSNNMSIALNTIYVPGNTEEIRLAYKSKHNLTHKNKVILLMITDGKKWHYLAAKNYLVYLEEKLQKIMETLFV